MTSVKSETASQTAGPYVHIGCTPNSSGVAGVFPEDLGSNLKSGTIAGQAITIKGTVFDGDGEPLLDAMIEIWQADARGIYSSQEDENSTSNFSGWGRCAGDMATGEFRFDTIKPGQVQFDDDSLQAPHITFWIVARGINKGLHTRLYFADEETANQVDPLLTSIEDRDRIPTLLAKTVEEGVYQFDIHLQGPKETIFFDI